MMGMGIFSDRTIADGAYAHSITYEMVLNFGVVVGTVILAFLAWLLARTVFYLRSKAEQPVKDFYRTLLFSAVLKLFISGSYLTEPYFFFTVGFALSAIEGKRVWTPMQKREEHTELPGGAYEQQLEK